jgi:hypothetical protein
MTSAADPKRCRVLVAAIFRQKDGPAVLESELRFCSSLFFLLNWSIFFDLDMAVHDVASPSGFIPDGGKGGHVRRSKFISDDPGLDCISTRFCGVLSVKSQDYVVFFIVEVLFVIVFPPHARL